jgi:hypothetical protein
MVRKLVQLGGALALVFVMPALAFAQLQSGSILVKAIDDQGSSVPGATVTLTSPVLPASLLGVTDSTGVYSFPSLAIGTYTVKVALKGFQTVIRENVVVIQNQTASVDMTMKVSALSEEVTVKGEPPVVDSRRVNVAVNLDAKLLETTPGGKDIWSILESKVPGIVFDTPDVGGNQAGLQRGFTARGTANNQNTQYLNGVNVGDPAAIGFSMNYYDPSAFANIQVSSGAQDISVGTPGVFVNMVTKSGTNRLNGQFLETYQGKDTQWDNIDGNLKSKGFRPEANAVDYITNTNGQAGGPLIHNKLFYFGSVNFQPTHVNVPGFPPVVPAQIPTLLANTSIQDTTDILTGEAKITYQATATNRFESYVQKQRYDKPNRDIRPSVTQDSNTKELDTDVTFQGLWNWVLSDRMFLVTNVNYNNVHFPLSQKTNLQPINDNFSGIQLRNATATNNMFRRRYSATSNWQYYLPNFLKGRHEFKIGFDNSYTPEDVTTTRVDDLSLQWRSQQISASQPAGPVSVTINNTPTLVRAAVNNTALFGQDAFSFKRLTAIAGIRWERVEGSIPAQTHGESQYFPNGTVINGLNVTLNTGGTLTSYTVQDRFAAVHDAPLWKNWAPRFSATYDLFGTGRTAVKFSAGKYLYQIGTGTPGPNPNGGINQRYAWIDLNNDLNFQRGNAVWDGTKYVGGEFGTLQNTSIPNPNPFDKSIGRTSQNEVTVGLDHELFPAILTTATFIHRREHDVRGTVDQNLSDWDRIYSKVPVRDQGPDGKTDTTDDQTIMVYSLNRRLDGTLETTATKTVNDDRLATHYNGVELTVNKRYSNGWTVLGGYTYSHTHVDLTSLANPNAAYVNASGEGGGRRHNFKISGSYTFPYHILFGANYQLQSGLPITRTFTVGACSATVLSNCVNQGTLTVNAVPRGSIWLEPLGQFSLRAGRLFKFGTNSIEIDMDVYNLTNANTVYAVRTGSTTSNVIDYTQPNRPVVTIPQFKSPTGVLGPRIIRFGITYVFGTGGAGGSSK